MGYIDFLGCISAFAVVMLHTNEVFHIFSYEAYWVTANAIECLMYFAVPVFLLISAATLLNYRERYSTKEFFIRRMHKTLIPFFVWSLAAMAAQYVYKGGGGVKTEGIADISLEMVFNGIFNFRFLSIYSFFGYLFSMYLAVPVLSDISDKIKVFRYMAATGILLNSFVPLLCSLMGVEWGFVSFDICAGYMIYLPLGFLLSKEDFSKKNRIIIYVLGIIGLAVHSFGTYFLSVSEGSLEEVFKGYTNLPCILYSCAVFTFGRYAYPHLEKRFTRLPRWISVVSRYTFGVYLIHIYIVRILMMLTKADIYSLAWRLGSPFVVFPVSILIVWGVRKLPYGKRVFPA